MNVPKLLIVLGLWLGLTTTGWAQKNGKFVAPKFKLTYEGTSVNLGEGIYVPRQGYFKLNLSNPSEIKDALPEDAYLTFVSSEAVLTRKSEQIRASRYNPHEFLNQDLDLIPLLSEATTNDNLSLRVNYMYVSSNKGKTRIIEEGTSLMNIIVK